MSNSIKISVEASGPTFQVVTCNAHDANIRLDTLDNGNPEKSMQVSRTFNLIELPDAGGDAATGGKPFVLQSESTKAYLGFGLNGRRLLTRTTQFPPPDSFRFRFQSGGGYGYLDVGAPAHIVAADGEPPRTQPYSIEDSWKQQSSVVSAIGGVGVDDDVPIYDDDPPEEVKLLGKGGGGDLDNSRELSMLAELRKTGELEDAIDVLSEEKYDDAPNAPVDPRNVVKAAKVLCIMDLCVYMRDHEREEAIHLELQPYADKIRKDLEEKRPASSDTLGAMMKVQQKTDRATQKIQEVMYLDYIPALHARPLLQGTGPLKEWVTDGKFNWKDVTCCSPLKGNCHIGFFDGVWKDFPGDLSTTKEIRQILPFQMMRNQLWKLERKLARPPYSLRVQLWMTGHSLGGAYATNCWAGFLADMHFMHTTVRGLVTFGSPRVGDKTYSTYARDIKGFRKSWRFVNGNDVVPGIPYCTWKFWKDYYYHVDTLVKINETTIELGPSELKSKTAQEKAVDGGNGPEDNAGEGDGEGEAVGVFGKISFADHGLNKYWSSLKTGVLKSTAPWP
ncbi:hypothetical protein DL767_004628 [Monosporascus sp. MG133]|nr:hypothetical protein DL767_004628 [Monosporascus sp. MG133]